MIFGIFRILQNEGYIALALVEVYKNPLWFGV